jgi:transposase-like protein
VGGDHLDRPQVREVVGDLPKWVRRAEPDDGLGPGLASNERERVKTLAGEHRELRRANQIL